MVEANNYVETVSRVGGKKTENPTRAGRGENAGGAGVAWRGGQT